MDKATIVNFDPQKGFGTLRLNEGTELPFDVSACNRVPESGEEAEVEIGTNRFTNKPKAQRVILPEETTEKPRRSLEEAIPILQSLGFLRGWNLADVEAALRENGDDVREWVSQEDAIHLIQLYVVSDPERARREGFLIWDWRFMNDTDNPVQDLLQLASAPSLCRFAGFRGELMLLEDQHGVRFELDVAFPAGLVPLLLDLNRRLAEAGEPQRLHSLDTQSDFYLLVARPVGWEKEFRGCGLFPADELLD